MYSNNLHALTNTFSDNYAELKTCHCLVSSKHTFITLILRMTASEDLKDRGFVDVYK